MSELHWIQQIHTNTDTHKRFVFIWLVVISPLVDFLGNHQLFSSDYHLWVSCHNSPLVVITDWIIGIMIYQLSMIQHLISNYHYYYYQWFDSWHTSITYQSLNSWSMIFHWYTTVSNWNAVWLWHSDWWFGAFGLFFQSVGNFIIPTAEVIFFKGVGQPPTRYIIVYIYT